jgi:hypothetical protein
MKLTILAPALALCGGLALAQNPGTTTSKPQDTKRSSEHKMTAEIVSTDATAQQITVRKLSMGGTSATEPADAPTFTLKVEGKALTRLSSVKSGDQVTISCKAMASGADTASSGAMGGTISSQAVADQHCASVTDISPSKSSR